MGLLPDGDEPAASEAGEDGRRRRPDRKSMSPWPRRCARLRSGDRCWRRVFATALIMRFPFISFRSWFGKDSAKPEAALLLSVYAFLGMAATLMLGWFADKANKPRMTAFILFVAAGAMFLPIVWQLAVVAVPVYDFLCRGGDDFSAWLGGGRRSIRQKALRQDSRLYGFVLHMGRSSRSGDRRSDLRPLANLRAALVVPGWRIHRGGSVLRRASTDPGRKRRVGS